MTVWSETKTHHKIRDYKHRSETKHRELRGDPWQALAARVVVQAVEDIHARDLVTCLDAYFWLIGPGQDWLTALGFDVEATNLFNSAGSGA